MIKIDVHVKFPSSKLITSKSGDNNTFTVSHKADTNKISSFNFHFFPRSAQRKETAALKFVKIKHNITNWKYLSKYLYNVSYRKERQHFVRQGDNKKIVFILLLKFFIRILYVIIR